MTSPSEAFDHAMMAIALAVARRGLGTTAPNPSVGAVIADETMGEVIARGWTQPGGRPHAETAALRRAGDRARGATLYVTLEPCSHLGATPPCADAIIAAGIGRVVAAIADPDPRVAGRGLERLRAAGIAVERGLMANEANWITRGHILRATERRPFIQIKMALAPDGSVPHGSGGKPTWVTGDEARAYGHVLRAETDGILVGRRTVVDDDPDLTCRLPGLADRSPVRIVLARSAEGVASSKLVRSAGDVPVWVFCGVETDPAVTRDLETRGARVFRVPVTGGRLWLAAVMETVASEGLTRVLVEGGPAVWSSFLDAGLADEAVVFRAAEQEHDVIPPSLRGMLGGGDGDDLSGGVIPPIPNPSPQGGGGSVESPSREHPRRWYDAPERAPCVPPPLWGRTGVGESQPLEWIEAAGFERVEKRRLGIDDMMIFRRACAI